MVRFNLRRRFQRRVSLLRRCIRRFLNHMLLCSSHGKSSRYLVLPSSITADVSPPPAVPVPVTGVESCELQKSNETSTSNSCESDVDYDDLVALKVCLLGDCKIGKSSFLAKYVGKEKERGGMEMEGLNSMEKTLFVKDARISFSIWEVEGNSEYKGQIPIACENSVAIIFMFDLTSRRTLNSVINWYQQARKFNQTAIPILVGTKFDDFIQLPIDLQWTIASQARAYAKAINATLFFSSATYNINVNKIFKFITAKLFDLPWSVERNLTIGEPMIDF